jgi:hypothetical protein
MLKVNQFKNTHDFSQTNYNKSPLNNMKFESNEKSKRRYDFKDFFNP